MKRGGHKLKQRVVGGAVLAIVGGLVTLPFIDSKNPSVPDSDPQQSDFARCLIDAKKRMTFDHTVSPGDENVYRRFLCEYQRDMGPKALAHIQILHVTRKALSDKLYGETDLSDDSKECTVTLNVNKRQVQFDDRLRGHHRNGFFHELSHCDKTEYHAGSSGWSTRGFTYYPSRESEGQSVLEEAASDVIAYDLQPVWDVKTGMRTYKPGGYPRIRTLLQNLMTDVGISIRKIADWKREGSLQKLVGRLFPGDQCTVRRKIEKTLALFNPLFDKRRSGGTYEGKPLQTSDFRFQYYIRMKQSCVKTK